MKMGMLGILVANKVEMAEERQISTSMAQGFCDADNLHYFEASAVRFNLTSLNKLFSWNCSGVFNLLITLQRENSGVEDAFKYLANEWNSRKFPLK